jgi:hypothetical protein
MEPFPPYRPFPWFDIAVLIGILFMLDLLVVSLMIAVITILSQ